MAAALQLSRATIMAHIKRLEKKGLIRRYAKHHRTLEVIEDIQGVAPKPTPKERAKKTDSALDWLRSTG